MARKGISKGQVFTAATALTEEGIPPTVQAVRDRIGSGSYSTVNTHLATWRQERAGHAVANIPDMPEKIAAAFQQVWAAAARAAQEGVETQRQALDAMRREMDQEKNDMAAEIERLERELQETADKASTLDKELDAARKGRATAENQVTGLRIENARLDERAKAAEGRAGEMKTQLDGLQARLAGG